MKDFTKSVPTIQEIENYQSKTSPKIILEKLAEAINEKYPNRIYSFVKKGENNRGVYFELFLNFIRFNKFEYKFINILSIQENTTYPIQISFYGESGFYMIGTEKELEDIIEKTLLSEKKNKKSYTFNVLNNIAMRFLIELAISLVILIAILTVLGLIICFIENIFNKTKKQKSAIVEKAILKHRAIYDMQINSFSNTKHLELSYHPIILKNNKITTKPSSFIKKENKEESKNTTYTTDNSYLTNYTSSQIITDSSNIITDCPTSFDF